MGSIDAQAKRYFSDNARFADLFNYLIYDGETVIRPEALSDLDSSQPLVVYGNGGSEAIQKYRDLLRLWRATTDGTAVYVALGAELQANVHYAMPVRSGLYDFAHYAKQVEAAGRALRGKRADSQPTGDEFLSGFRKKDRLMPVITLVVYLGTSRWDGPLSLHEMLNTTDRRLLALAPDYRIHLIAPFSLQDDDFPKFKTDVQQVLRYLKHASDKEALRRAVFEDEHFRSMDVESARLIEALTGSRLRLEAKKGRVDMCKAIEDMRQDAINQGISQGISQGIEQGINQGIDIGRMSMLGQLVDMNLLSVQNAARAVNLSEWEFLQKKHKLDAKAQTAQ